MPQVQNAQVQSVQVGALPIIGYSPGLPEPFVLLSVSPQALGLVNTAAQKENAAASATWAGVNLAIFIPFTLMTPRTYRGMIWMNGAAVSGNVNAAVYSADGTTALATIGSVAQAGTTAPQKKAFATPLLLAAGDYSMALALDNTTGTIVGQTTLAAVTRPAGARQLASFFALTASAVAWVGLANNRLPLFGLYEPSWL